MNYRSRPIKFRAWDKINNRWYTPTFEAYKGNLYELEVSFSGDLTARTMNGSAHESTFSDQYELMQFTGLMDKNGVEIWEGDIVTCKVGPNTLTWPVVWSEGGAQWSKGYQQLSSYQKTTTVVGNIYENPDLVRSQG